MLRPRKTTPEQAKINEVAVTEAVKTATKEAIENGMDEQKLNFFLNNK